MNNPHFVHEDCSCCHFLGSYEGANGVADLYYHDGRDITVLARFSNEPSDYREGIEVAIKNKPNEYLAEAWKRAKTNKLVRREVSAYYNLFKYKSFIQDATFEMANSPELKTTYGMSEYLELSDAIDNALHILYNYMHRE